MAISTYAALKSEITSWSLRNDSLVTDRIPNFIALAEARINRSIATRENEVETELSMTPGSRYVALPASFNYPLGLWLKAWLPRQRLQQVLASELPVKTNVSGYPEYWAVDGSNIAFDKLASAAHTFDLRYVADKTLSDTSPANYVLTNYPDLYLWGSLVELASFVRDDKELQKYEARYQQALQDAMDNENSAKERAPLATEIAANNRNGRFNILRGY